MNVRRLLIVATLALLIIPFMGTSAAAGPISIGVGVRIGGPPAPVYRPYAYGPAYRPYAYGFGPRPVVVAAPPIVVQAPPRIIYAQPQPIVIQAPPVYTTAP